MIYIFIENVQKCCCGIIVEGIGKMKKVLALVLLFVCVLSSVYAESGFLAAYNEMGKYYGIKPIPESSVVDDSDEYYSFKTENVVVSISKDGSTGIVASYDPMDFITHGILSGLIVSIDGETDDVSRFYGLFMEAYFALTAGEVVSSGVYNGKMFRMTYSDNRFCFLMSDYANMK